MAESPNDRPPDKPFDEFAKETRMKRHILGALGGIMMLGLAVSGVSRADEVIYDGSAFITGTVSNAETFNLISAGTLTVTLTNQTWPVQLANLSLSVSTANGPVGPSMAPGTETFQVGAGLITAQWFGTAQGSLDTGVYSLSIDFAPTIAPVPLPASAGLLLSGLCLLLFQRRSKAFGLSRV
jgi:hypothetical protein